MAGFNIALTPAKEYLTFLTDKCRTLCAEQAEGENAYNKLGFEWNDKIYVRTGIEMKTTAQAISKIYDIMADTIKNLYKRIVILCEYNETPAPSPVRVEPFTIRLQEGNTPPNELIETDHEALLRFERALKKYMDAVLSNINQIKRKHSDMYAYWKDQYYNRFTAVVDEFSQLINVQLGKLEFLNQLVEKKRQILMRAS